MNWIVLLLFFIVLLSTSAQAQVELSLQTDRLTVHAGESVELKLRLTNLQARHDEFALRVWPTYWAGTSVRLEAEYVELAAGQSKEVSAWFDASPLAEGALIFKFSATSLKDFAVRDEEEFTLLVERKLPYRILELSLNSTELKPGSAVGIVVVVENPTLAPVVLGLELKLVKELALKKWEVNLSLPANTKESLSFEYTFNPYASPGIYVLEANLLHAGLVVHSATSSLKILRVEFDYEPIKSVRNRLLWVETSVTFKNQGNVPSQSFLVVETLPFFLDPLFKPRVEPHAKNFSFPYASYTWLVQGLEPGAEASIDYSLVLWPVWLLVAAVTTMGTMTYNYIYSLRIYKDLRYKGRWSAEREFPVVIEVVNKTPKEFSNVVVEDFIPPLAKVVKVFDTIPPQLKEGKEGTRLIWKVGRLKPKEERVLTYKIKPVVEIVGTLKLPRAKLYYGERKHRRALLSKGKLK